MKHKIGRMVISLILGFTLAMTQMSPAHAAGFIVNDTSDAVDVNLGDGTCATSTGTCTIRAAVMEANALPGDDVISLPPGTYTLSIPGSLGSNTDVSGNLDIMENLIINGSGATNTIIDGNGSIVHNSVLQIEPNTSLDISGVTIQGGLSVEGGGIVNLGYLTVTDSIVSNNNVSGSYGGGIFNHSLGTVILNDSIVSNNNATYGGGIGNLGTITITNSTVSGNSGYTGGGIFNYYGNVGLNNSTVSGNISSASGSGIRNIGTLSLTDSTVMNNSATGSGVSGAGISNEGYTLMFNSIIIGNTSTNIGAGINNWGTFRLINSTISGNSPGGIVNASTLEMYNVTITNNISNSVGGGIHNFGFATLQNTIVGGNFGSGGSPDCFGELISKGYNLIQNSTGCTISGDTTGNVLGISPILGSIQNNGGPTLTHALLSGSPAIDAGNPIGCKEYHGRLLSTDQRGVARPQGVACDIGAYEFVATLDVSIDIKPGSDTNPINPNSNGSIPVAILSTPDFDAPSMVEKASLTFGKTGDEASLAFCNDNGEDVNSDGLLDLVCHFYTQATGFQLGDLTGNLKGMTMDGTPLEGADNISVLK